ncbi:MAG: hypothetical protein Q8S73_23380 [Deltaproteobacteria bacterium]|nr:hypothetical protein [Myxococcales bacterium]MDP3217073.1 hypothetical protein [Deltaproteobacteria bacterium]
MTSPFQSPRRLASLSVARIVVSSFWIVLSLAPSVRRPSMYSST